MFSIFQNVGRVWRQFCLMLGNQRSLRLYLQPIIQLFNRSYHGELVSVKLVDSCWQTPTMRLLTLSVPKSWKGFKPGQHIVLTVKDNGKYISRPFSICSSHDFWIDKKQIQISCKVNESGEFTSLLPELNLGSRMYIGAAQGEFVFQRDQKQSTFIAAGSGITPIHAMLASVRDWSQPILLFYRVRGEQEAAFINALTHLQNQYANFDFRLSNSASETTDEFQLALKKLSVGGQFYLCGPSAFMQETDALLKANGVSASHIHQEVFGVRSQPMTTRVVEKIAAIFVRHGKQSTVESDNHSSLLEAAEKHDLAPQYGCRMGVCYQCVCQKVSGQVQDMRTGKLSGHGREQIQLCVSQPISDLVIEY